MASELAPERTDGRRSVSVASGRENAHHGHDQPISADPGCFQIHGNIGVKNTRPATCVHASVVCAASAPASLRVASTYPELHTTPATATRTIGWSVPVPGRVAITTPRNPSAIATIRSALTLSPNTGPARRATKTGVRNEIVAVSESWSSRMANTFAVVEQNSKTERNSCSRGRLERSMAGRDRDRDAMSAITDAPT